MDKLRESVVCFIFYAKEVKEKRISHTVVGRKD